MLKYLEPFNCVQTIVIFVCNKLILIPLKIILPTNYWFTNHMYNHLNVCKQMNSGSFENIIYKLCLQIIICTKRIWHLITYNGWYDIKPNQTILLLAKKERRTSLLNNPTWVGMILNQPTNQTTTCSLSTISILLDDGFLSCFKLCQPLTSSLYEFGIVCLHGRGFYKPDTLPCMQKQN